MSRFIGRNAVLCSMFLLLSACQSAAPQFSQPTVDEFAVAEVVFATHLAAQQLDAAGVQLQDLRDKYPEQPSVQELQQRLADAWLARGEQALHNADIDAASAALIEAKRLLPQAPALTQGLSRALAAAQAPVVKPVVAAPAPLKKPVARKPVRTQPSAPISQPVTPVVQDVVAPATVDQPVAQVPVTPSRPTSKARIINTDADFTLIPMPMLNARNDHQLGRLLDKVAADVVSFRAIVTIEVADTRDFHWVATLLNARVNKLDANFKPRLQEVRRSETPAQLMITPNRSL